MSETSVKTATNEIYIHDSKQPVLLALGSLRPGTKSVFYRMTDPLFDAKGTANVLAWKGQSYAFATINAKDPAIQGRNLLSCSHCQELCQQASWLLIGSPRVNNQSKARKVS